METNSGHKKVRKAEDLPEYWNVLFHEDATVNVLGLRDFISHVHVIVFYSQVEDTFQGCLTDEMVQNSLRTAYWRKTIEFIFSTRNMLNNFPWDRFAKHNDPGSYITT